MIDHPAVRFKGSGGGTIIIFIYAIIVAAIMILILKIFAFDKERFWNVITKRYKTAHGASYRDTMKKEAKYMEDEFGKPISAGFRRHEEETPLGTQSEIPFGSPEEIPMGTPDETLSK